MRAVRSSYPGRLQEDAAAEADFPESARSVVFISSSYAVIAAPERGGVCDFQSDGRQTAKLFGIRLAPNGIAVFTRR